MFEKLNKQDFRRIAICICVSVVSLVIVQSYFTKVFPDADIKFFVTADVQIRAKRRFEEMNSKDISFDQVLNNLTMRDENDTSREINPLKMAEDAILIDNTDKSLEHQNNFVFSEIEKVLQNEN